MAQRLPVSSLQSILRRAEWILKLFIKATECKRYAGVKIRDSCTDSRFSALPWEDAGYWYDALHFALFSCAQVQILVRSITINVSENSEERSYYAKSFLISFYKILVFQHET